MVFSIKSSIVAVILMAGTTLAKGKNVGVTVKEITKGPSKTYEIALYVNAKTGESCRVTCVQTDASPCKSEPVKSSWGNYSCEITSFSPHLVGVEIVDGPGGYTFKGVHYYDDRNIVEEHTKRPDLIYYEKNDNWPLAQ